MATSAYQICMEIAGPTAMWTRPDTGDSPVSYPAPTSSAVKAIFESVLWGPDVEIIPVRTEICSPIQYHSYATNYGGPLRNTSSIREGNNYQFFATVLIDVCYRLYAEVQPQKTKKGLPESALLWDRKTTSPGHAYQAIFSRRLRRGQCYAMPFLGWKEFVPSYFGPFRSGTMVESGIPDIKIPSMLFRVFPDGFDSKVDYQYENNVLIHQGSLDYSREDLN